MIYYSSHLFICPTLEICVNSEMFLASMNRVLCSSDTGTCDYNQIYFIFSNYHHWCPVLNVCFFFFYFLNLLCISIKYDTSRTRQVTVFDTCWYMCPMTFACEVSQIKLFFPLLRHSLEAQILYQEVSEKFHPLSFHFGRNWGFACGNKTDRWCLKSGLGAQV